MREVNKNSVRNNKESMVEQVDPTKIQIPIPDPDIEECEHLELIWPTMKCEVCGHILTKQEIKQWVKAFRGD
jgi:hypothetical protein